MDTYIGTICYFAFGFAPPGWEDCNGASMSVNNNQALYALIGNKFGGNYNVFNLPSIAPIKDVNGITINAYICTQGIFPPRK